MKNPVLYFEKPNHISVVEESIPKPKSNEILIQNIMSGISAGTEMLFYRGLVPPNLNIDSTIPSLHHRLTYPCKYGYCSLGKVIEVGHQKFRHLDNKLVFVFNPHEGYFCTTEQQIIEIPDGLSPEDALFIPNMETAINLVLDGAPLIGENVLILGLGIVGLLTTALLTQFPLSHLFGIDLFEKRRALCQELGATSTFDAAKLHIPEPLKQNPIDLIYELSGNPDALNRAIECSGYETRIVLGSWYGNKPCLLNLGGTFHRNRIKIISSQVSTIASELAGRWSKKRRFEVVFKMLETIKPSRFISHSFHIKEANKAYELLDSNPNDALFITLNYEDF